MGELAVLSGLLSFVVGLVLLIVFFVMASNVGSILRTLRRIEMNSMSMKDSLEKLTGQVAPGQMTNAEKAKAFDQSAKK